MPPFVALLLFALIFPCVWGVLVHLALALLWPPEKRRAAWTEPDSNPFAQDYQI